MTVSSGHFLKQQWGRSKSGTEREIKNLACTSRIKQRIKQANVHNSLGSSLSSSSPKCSSGHDVDAQEECPHAISPRAGRQECAQSARLKSHAVSQITRLCEGTVCLETLLLTLLVPHQQGHLPTCPLKLCLPPSITDILRLASHGPRSAGRATCKAHARGS